MRDGVAAMHRLNYLGGDAREILGQGQQDRDVLAMDGSQRSGWLRPSGDLHRWQAEEAPCSSSRLRVCGGTHPQRSGTTSRMSHSILRQSRSSSPGYTAPASRCRSRSELSQDALPTWASVLAREHLCRDDWRTTDEALPRMSAGSMATTRDAQNERGSWPGCSLLARIPNQASEIVPRRYCAMTRARLSQLSLLTQAPERVEAS